MDIKGAHIIVTGGSLGIGKATAKSLVDKGAKVVITGRSQERLEKAAAEIGAIPVVFDISQLGEGFSENAQACIDALDGRVDVLVNNAGIGEFPLLEDVTLEAFEKVFNTNVFGLALFTKEVIVPMKAQQSGTIINIASTAALKGFARGTVYSASKFAVRSMTQCWQGELRKDNIRVCLINPSEVTTAFANTERTERPTVNNKLDSDDIAHSIVSVIEMKDKGFIPELTVWATNPF